MVEGALRKSRVLVNAGWTMVEAKVFIPLCSLTSTKKLGVALSEKGQILRMQH